MGICVSRKRHKKSTGNTEGEGLISKAWHKKHKGAVYPESLH